MAVQLGAQLTAVGAELLAERDVTAQLRAQLAAVGAELAAERDVTAQLRAQLTGVGEELRTERDVSRKLHDQLVSVGGELRAVRGYASRGEEQLSALTQRIVMRHGNLTAEDLRAVDPKIWALALEEVVVSGGIDAAAQAAPRLARAFPAVRYLRTMETILQQSPAPPSDPVFASFVDDVSVPFQLVRRRDADTLLLAFCGAGPRRQLGIPINLMHRWFGQIGVHVAYCRDLRLDNMEGGMDGIAASYADVVELLRQRAADLTVRRILCFGNSFGGYSALRVGLDLGADAVLVFSGPTNTMLEFEGEAPRRGIEAGRDLRPLYAAAGSRAPRVHLVYSADHASERAHALNMVGLERVTTAAVAGRNEHGVIRHLVEHGCLADHLHWLADPQRAAAGPQLA
jgi:hypothetical protein